MKNTKYLCSNNKIAHHHRLPFGKCIRCLLGTSNNMYGRQLTGDGDYLFNYLH